MLFDYVVQHELAIVSFTTIALAAERNAFDPVLRLGKPTRLLNETAIGPWPCPHADR